MLSMGFGELTKNAEEVMLRIRRRELEGLVPSTVAFEFTVHWLRGRIPSLTSINEVRTFLQSYFEIVELNFEDFMESAKIKKEGDDILSIELKGRKLSIVDSTIIHTAKKMKAKIVTGDKDLTLVAKKMGIGTIW
ncbi:PIN domain-containing protein [Metallosphaera hakonensis JCM 8857 = DSM 7519]|uniref:PIN domain nuclease n=2 Tax=Metallosphaera hakonensis TaxID=79601 RepID=A0A2U9IXS4_9CREN|nr:PIN domain-containing protein [Metallosphaera hakonensis JCM 8857 = DSM 7519]